MREAPAVTPPSNHPQHAQLLQDLAASRAALRATVGFVEHQLMLDQRNIHGLVTWSNLYCEHIDEIAAARDLNKS